MVSPLRAVRAQSAASPSCNANSISVVSAIESGLTSVYAR
ncbi:Uncharacterised protein [Mycobacteroides abscessus subsp. abscessus]|nr:Uncharacterised protein [Mycobacteroides abscessus subsp. abscessus]